MFTSKLTSGNDAKRSALRSNPALPTDDDSARRTRMSNLPSPAIFPSVLKHSATVKSKAWRPKFEQGGSLPLWEMIFNDRAEIVIARERLLHDKYENAEQKCAEILLYSYPTDTVGLASNLFGRLKDIAVAAQKITSWPDYIAAFKPTDTQVEGSVGPILASKFAYFFGLSFEGRPALVIDNKIARGTTRWSDLQIIGLDDRKGADEFYPLYLQRMHQAAAKLRCSADQLELLLGGA